MREKTGEIWVNSFDEKAAYYFREQVILKAEADHRMPIVVYIDSYGGNVDGLAKMVATINEIPNQVITVCMGKAMSAGAILLSCGDYRFCDPFSRVMIHNVGGAAMGDLVDQKASVQEGERLNERFNGMLAKNMGKTYDELLKLFLSAPDNRNLYLSPEEAKNLGIVDAVGAPHIVPQVEWTFYAAPEKKRGMNTVVKDQDADLEAILNALSGLSLIHI